MIRKQLYISDDHERALKAKARDAGISEAELIRRLLDRFLLDRGSRRMPIGREKAALDFLQATDEIIASHRFAEDYRFKRENLYEDRGYPDHAK